MPWTLAPLAALLGAAGAAAPDVAPAYALRDGRRLPALGLRAPPALLRWAFGGRVAARMAETEHRAVSETVKERVWLFVGDWCRLSLESPKLLEEIAR